MPFLAPSVAPDAFQWLSCALTSAWLASAVAWDLARRRVPNRLLAAGALVALLSLALGVAPFELRWNAALLGAAAAFGLLLPAYAVSLLAAGDVKFAAVLGLAVGLPSLGPIAIGAGLLAGLHALAWLCLETLRTVRGLLRTPDGIAAGSPGCPGSMDTAEPERSAEIPYAGYLAAAGLAWTGLRLLGATA